MTSDRRHHCPGVVLYLGHFPAVMRWEPAADVDHAQINVGCSESREHSSGGADGSIPLSELGLLRADMKRYPVRIKAQIAGLAQQVERHFGSAAEFPRQWPLGALAGNKDATEHPRAGGRPRQLLELAHTVEGKEPQARLI